MRGKGKALFQGCTIREEQRNIMKAGRRLVDKLLVMSLIEIFYLYIIATCDISMAD